MAASAAAAAAGLAQAAGPGPLRIYGVELPPLIMATPYGVTGIVTEITLRACRRAGLDAEVEVVPWARGVNALKSGQCDGLIPTIRSAEREALFDFPGEPVYRSDMSLFGRADRLPAFSGQLGELAERRFVRLRGALFAPEFDEAVREGRLHCEEANSFSAALRMVDAGRVDFAAVPRLAGLQIVASEGLSGRVAALSPPLYRQPFYVALARKPGLADVRRRLDEQLARMWRDGSIAAVEDEYRRRNWLPPGPAKAG
jgi:polar amino acid transport system substrate-binding protein